MRLSKLSICVRGLARLWGRSRQGGYGWEKILSGHVKDIDAWYLHDGRDIARVLVGSKAIIILPPLAQLKPIVCFRYGVCARIEQIASQCAVQRVCNFCSKNAKNAQVDSDTGYDRHSDER